MARRGNRASAEAMGPNKQRQRHQERISLEDQGPHQLILTIMRKTMHYFASDNGGKNIHWYELFFMFRTYGCGWQQVYQIDDVIQNFIDQRDIPLESEVTPDICIDMLKEDGLYVDPNE